MLFHRGAHEPLAGGSWDARRARYAVDDIVDEALRGFDGTAWPHAAGDCGEGVYSGAAGVVYALRRLGATPPVSAEMLLSQATEESFISGALGVALVAFREGVDVADRIESAARATIESGENDLCDGAAGAVVAGMRLFEETRDERWATLVGDGVSALWSSWAFDREVRACIWTQKRADGTRQLLGAAHGVAGNAQALLQAAQLQTREHQRELLERTVDTLTRTAIRERGLANWPDRADAADARPRVQWCHGAAGVVIALADAPRHAPLDALLLEAGELVWTAGPLKKGYSLCHGTAGNGFAFLKLHKRTRDTKWLDRARRFAMHAVAQWERREAPHHSLFTGDVGLALYLRACIEVDERFPLIDVL
jgi:hypothetical protein